MKISFKTPWDSYLYSKEDYWAGLAVIAALIAVAVLILWLIPGLVFWALATVFGLSTSFTFKTWFATLVLMLAFGANVSFKK